MTGRQRAATIVVPFGLAALELNHPSWSQGAVAQAVAAAGGWWLALHLLLVAGYAGMVWLLWARATVARVALVAFLLGNTAFLGVDGIGVGLLAASDPGAADRLWNSTVVMLLANLSGAAWAASLLSRAAFSTAAARTRPALIGLGLTWLAFVASAPPLIVPSTLSRLAAVATGAWVIYLTGASSIPFALLVFAAILRQHVGAEAALGMVLTGLALARQPERG